MINSPCSGKEKALTKNYLKELLDYNKETGVFVWNRNGRGRRKGSVAGTKNDRYIKICINKKQYYAHRLAWFNIHGYWPSEQIDHINRDKKDNRICNLRSVTRQENARNLDIPSNNTSGVIGVTWNKLNNKWQSQIKISQKCIVLGFNISFFEAVCLRKSAESKYGFHANHGIANA